MNAVTVFLRSLRRREVTNAASRGFFIRVSRNILSSSSFPSLIASVYMLYNVEASMCWSSFWRECPLLAGKRA